MTLRAMTIGLVGCVCFARAGIAQNPVLPSGAAQRQETPWSRSLALEAANNLAQARQVLVSAYGAQPDIYDVCVRLAWLSLRMGDGRTATKLYRKARTLPGALPEATQGLQSALTLSGYQDLDRGNYGDARRHWHEAATFDTAYASPIKGLDLVGPSHGGVPEAWLGFLSSTKDTVSVRVFYLAYAYRINDDVSLRAAYRKVVVGDNADTARVFGPQSEYYAGITLERGITATELLVLSMSNSVNSTSGFAVSTRVGGHYGATLTAAALHRPSGTNSQIIPQGFAWLKPWLALSGGVRVTHDPAFSATSPLAGGTVRFGALELDTQMHFGKERLAFSPAGPTIMSLNGATSSGWTATLALVVGGTTGFTVYAQKQFEKLLTPDGTADRGTYSGFALGVRVNPGR